MRRPGFTFIELLTTFGIIAILAAILFPVFAKSREKARQTNCLHNQVNIGIALKIYAADHYGHFPPADDCLAPLVPECLPDPAALHCPTAADEHARRPSGPAPDADFVYRGGLCDDDLPGNLMLADDESLRHNEGCNYLFLDGHAKWMKSPSAADGWSGVQEIRALQGLPPDEPEGGAP